MPNEGYIDLQVNGYAGIDFNQDSLRADELNFACQRLKEDGVAGVLATIITDSLDRMLDRLKTLVELRNHDPLAQEVIIGIHIEGPFISPEVDFRGAHPPDAILPSSEDVMQRLLEAAGGLTRIVTLAPECDAGFTVTRLLAKQGIVVSAGHCDCSLDQLDAAIDAGLSMFTHLGNGCPMVMHRHDNILQRALYRSDKLWISFIADGVHVNVLALSNYLKLAGDRALVVTDAMAAAGMGPGNYQLGRWDIEVTDDLAAWAPGRSHLLGSAMTMAHAQQRLSGVMQLSNDRINQLLRTSPLRVLGESSLPITGLKVAAQGANAGPHFARSEKASTKETSRQRKSLVD